jgi:hypothetical protein
MKRQMNPLGIRSSWSAARRRRLVSAGRFIPFALCAGGALFLSACAGETSCEETRTCAPGVVGTGGNTTNDAGAGGKAGSGTGGASGVTGTGGNTGSGGASGGGGTEGGAGTAGADSGDAGDASDGGRADAGPRCSGTVGQREEGCPVPDPEGIFVSRLGEASAGDGSRAHPFTSIAAAINAAMSSKDAGSGDGGPTVVKRIYVCSDAGAYAETLKLDASANASHDGLVFYGGFSCADWKYTPAVRTKLASSETTAWTVSSLVKGLTIEDFDVSSKDATLSQTSSIAMIVNGPSKNVVLRRVRITAQMALKRDRARRAYRRSVPIRLQADIPATGLSRRACPTAETADPGGST